MFAQAAGGDEDGALARVRTSVGAQHQELVGLVSQFLVLNNRVQEEASQRNREVYERVVREIVVLVAALLVLVALIGAYTIWANRQAFQEVARLSDQLRTLSWRMLRIQEDLQQSFSRELHDDFGQVFTAIGTLLGRIKRNLPADSSLVGDVEEVLGIAQQTLERIRVQSRLLHPTVLDDFGLEKAVEWYVEQFGRQHDIATHFEVAGPIGVVADRIQHPHLSHRAGGADQRQQARRRQGSLGAHGPAQRPAGAGHRGSRARAAGRRRRRPRRGPGEHARARGADGRDVCHPSCHASRRDRRRRGAARSQGAGELTIADCRLQITNLRGFCSIQGRSVNCVPQSAARLDEP